MVTLRQSPVTVAIRYQPLLICALLRRMLRAGTKQPGHSRRAGEMAANRPLLAAAAETSSLPSLPPHGIALAPASTTRPSPNCKSLATTKPRPRGLSREPSEAFISQKGRLPQGDRLPQGRATRVLTDPRIHASASPAYVVLPLRHSADAIHISKRCRDGSACEC